MAGGAWAWYEPGPVLESASPSAACPNTTITLTGKHFGRPGTRSAWFAAGVSPSGVSEEAKILSETSATTRVPIFLALPGPNENGQVGLETTGGKRSNQISFTLSSLVTCFQGKEGPPGKEGKQGPAGKEGKEGPPGKEGKQGQAGNEGKEGKEGPIGKEGPEGKGGGSGLNAFAESQNGSAAVIPPTGPKVLESAPLTTTTTGSVYATAHGTDYLQCVAGGESCEFELALYVDGKGVPDSGQTELVSSGNTVEYSSNYSGVISGIPAGAHTVEFGYVLIFGPGEIKGFVENQVVALAFG
jgi:hypothetical protein